MHEKPVQSKVTAVCYRSSLYLEPHFTTTAQLSVARHRGAIPTQCPRIDKFSLYVRSGEASLPGGLQWSDSSYETPLFSLRRPRPGGARTLRCSRPDGRTQTSLSRPCL